MMQGIASPGNFFTEASTANLNSIAAGLISPGVLSAQNPQITCILEQGFDIPADHINSISTVPAYPKAAYNAFTGTITWSPGTLTTPIKAGSSVKYAEMIYRIKIDEDILNQTPVGNLYPINLETKLTYEDINNLPHTLDFPIPKVNPILITVEKLLYDSDGNPVTKDNDHLNRLFTIEIKSQILGADGAPVYHRTVKLGGSEQIVLTDFWAGGTYIVNETEVKKYGINGEVGDLGDYKTTYLVDGRMSNAFRVDQGGHDWSIQVKNEERHKGKITVYKAFDPTGSGSYDIPTETPPADAPIFGLKLTYPDGSFEDFTLKAGESRVFSDLPYGDYSVEETDSKGFEFTYSDTDSANGNLTDGRVTLSFLDQEDEVTVINRPADDALTVGVVGRLVWSGGPEADHTALQLPLKRDGSPLFPIPDYTVNPSSGTADSFTYTWSGMQNYSEWGIPYTYTIGIGPALDKYDTSVNDATRTVTYIYNDNPTQSSSSETPTSSADPT
ncbi:MAG: DUF5979 domain-containing protein, partial [Bacillota bacterium]|nr:DUF5979 domain-containing protein [Bacillota bacterium]